MKNEEIMRQQKVFIALTVPIVLAVISGACTKEAPKPVADHVAKASNEIVRIEVASNGYTPKTIAVRKGQTVRLQFLRKDTNNCGDELVFPTMNIKRTLPVGEVVEVDVTPEQSGEIKFSCGMDMMRGKLIVTE